MAEEKHKRMWSRLDNAAKIFPSTSHKTDTSVFRFYCELKEDIDPAVLQSAVNASVREYPNFLSAMRKGAFWYYLEETDTKPVVVPERDRLCHEIYDGDNSVLLFEVSYYRNRINLEIFHALTDGTGALEFLKDIVFHYIKLAHKEEISPDLVFMESSASHWEKNTDSFSKYYSKEKRKMPQVTKSVYNLKYKKNEEQRIRAIEAIADVKDVLRAAHENNTTLTVFLTAVFFESIRNGMSVQNLKKPVVLMVPVNLRQYFPSETTKNFFGLIDVKYDFSKESGEFGDIIEKINASFKEKLNAEFLAVRMNKLQGMERNFFAKMAPLPLKNLALRIARAWESRDQTAVISNVGRVKMPEEMDKFIDMFGVLSSTLKLQLCMCSFGNKLQMGFSSAFMSSDIEKEFVRCLTRRGIKIAVRSNSYIKDPEEGES